MLATGTVKWFNDVEGSGIITPDDGGEDLFAHFKNIQGDGFEALCRGQKVEFRVAHNPQGLHADFIRPIQDLLT